MGGGSAASAWRAAKPVEFAAAVPDDPFGWLPAVLLLGLLLMPTVMTVLGRRSLPAGTPARSPREGRP